MGSPLKRISPESGTSSAPSKFRRVDFPLPLEPMMARNSPLDDFQGHSSQSQNMKPPSNSRCTSSMLSKSGELGFEGVGSGIGRIAETQLADKSGSLQVFRYNVGNILPEARIRPSRVYDRARGGKMAARVLSSPLHAPVLLHLHFSSSADAAVDIACSAGGRSGGLGDGLFSVVARGCDCLQWAHPWLLWLLPVGGVAVGLIYHYLGKNSHQEHSSMKSINPAEESPRGWLRWSCWVRS